MMTTLNIRNVPESLARAIRADGAARGLTLPQWLAAVYDLYRDLRAREGTGTILIDADALRPLLANKRGSSGRVLSGVNYTSLDELLERVAR